MYYLSTIFVLLFTFHTSSAQEGIIIRKGELVDITFNAQLKTTDLEDIKKQLAKINISIEYPQVDFNKKGKLKALKFKVDTNDGFSGSAYSPRLSKKQHVYFYRDYVNKSSPFGTGVGRKKRR